MMKVLLCGANGFIGRSIHLALETAGHQVLAGVSHLPREAGVSVQVNYAGDTQSDIWLPRLAGVEVVINAVGVLRDSRRRPIEVVHQHTPRALFEACVQMGIPRIIQISALGVDQNHTRYASTKRAADEHLLALAEHSTQSLHASVLRPSIVFGRGGASSELFMKLARLPLLILPDAVLNARVQPIAVQDLASVVVALLHRPHSGVIECTGPEPVRLGEWIASLRQQCGYAPARVMRLPDSLARGSARLGDYLPASVPWCSEALQLLAKDNVAQGNQAAAVPAILGRPTLPYGKLVEAAWQ